MVVMATRFSLITLVFLSCSHFAPERKTFMSFFAVDVPKKNKLQNPALRSHYPVVPYATIAHDEDDGVDG